LPGTFDGRSLCFAMAIELRVRERWGRYVRMAGDVSRD
jgi:uncharacterized protein (DUF934 family)